MNSDPNVPGPDLPPVRPPSGRFIAQLFIVPGLIVFFVVLLVVGINYMFVGGHTADEFLSRIDSNNSDIRWRGANDLAQTLKRKESVNLRTDVGFALDLCERLDRAEKALEEDEKAIGERAKKDNSGATDLAYRKLESQRNLVNFLAMSLGDFAFPVGVPILADMIAKGEGPDVVNGSLRRRRALWALANLGNSVKGFSKLRPEHQSLILSKLHDEMKSASPVRSQGAKNALFYLKQEGDGNDPQIVHVDKALDRASRAEDQYLRELVAFGLNFWDGQLVDETLQRLSRDSGFGTLVEAPAEQ